MTPSNFPHALTSHAPTSSASMPVAPDPLLSSSTTPSLSTPSLIENNVSAPPRSDDFLFQNVPPLSFSNNRILRDTPTMPPKDRRSASASPFRLPMPLISPGQLAFSAMQFLPVPLLVLNNLKTVVLANEAMGRMLGLSSSSEDHQKDGASITDKLRGQTLSQVGIDMLLNGKPVWVSWESFLDGLVLEMGTKQAGEAPTSDYDYAHRDYTSTVDGLESKPNASTGSPEKPASDSAVDVVVMYKSFNKATVPKSQRSEYQTYAKMLITIWEIEDHQTYFTLTFTNTGSALSSAPDSRIPVARSSALEAAERKSISNSNPPSVSSSHDSNSPLVLVSPGSVSISSSPFPPMGPPSRLIQSSTPSFLQRLTIIKDALLDNTEMPILAMWKDGSAPVLNRAARSLFTNLRGADGQDGYDLLSQWDVWNEEFTRKYDASEFPIAVLLREQKPFSGVRIGMYDKEKDARVVFDVLGEVIRDDETGEFIAGVVTCRDVTHLTKEIIEIKEADEERFKLICDTMPQMVWTATSDGLYDFFNNRWYDYTGLTPEMSLGMNWMAPFHPDDLPATLRKWQHSLTTGDSYMSEVRCRSKDGEWRWMLGRALPLRNKQTGKIEKWFGTYTNVHETLEAKLAAKQTREQLLSVLTHARTTIFSVDRDCKVTMLEGALIWGDRKGHTTTDDDSNPDSQRFIGRNVDEVFNDLNPQLRHGEAPTFLKPAKELLAGKELKETVHEHEMDDHFFRTRFMPLIKNKCKDGQDSEPVIEGVIGVVMDVTELKEREQDLKEQVKEKRQLKANEAAAKEASRLKSQFLANMSHEIRTPITGVIGMAELLLDLPLGEEQREYAENVSRSANALLTVINDILDFSKVESGRLDIEEVQFSLSVVVQDVSKMLSFAAERKNLAFRPDIAPDIENSLVVLGDPGRVRQIITNLLTNSIKFTSNGYVKFSVGKEKETNDTIEIKFVIEDTGIGIEDDVRKRLFQPFSQGDPSTARKFGGTGLGLTISKNLLDLMNGRITLQSTVGHGTTATFWIPFSKPQSPSASSLVEVGHLPDRLQSEMSVSCNSSEHEHYLGTSPADILSPGYDKSAPPKRHRSLNLPSHHYGLDNEELPMSERAKIQVLVVEDNAINQQIATKTIKKLGFNVSAAWNGKEALEYLESCRDGKLAKPDIILMDVQMPVIDGYKCTHIMRHHVPYKIFTHDVPIVAMTASAIQGDREKCTKAGMDDYLAKPVKSKTLERMLVRWSKTRRKIVSGAPSAAVSGSDCSDLAERCPSADIPKFGLALDITPEQRSIKGEYERQDEDRTNLLTPKPLVRNGSHDTSTFPFALSQSTRQLDSNELAMHLRDDKLMDAASTNSVAKPVSHALQSSLHEGDSLTEENVEKLKKQGSIISLRR
ncbi:hypothetical protein F5X96DRAFT_674757 [Biscogniauxia mediterranea]|nr:hypothetical protein F5X96DRAFT_674757 [Biscogniauxia mediterranea]